MIKTKNKKVINFTAQIFILVLSIFYLIYRPFFITKVVGRSMWPSYSEGQILVATSLDKNYSIGDVVLIRHEEEILIKRVAYVPGQKILCANLGWREFCPIPPIKNIDRQVKYLNTHGVHAFIYEIPKEHVFVIGDNETESEDSRNFGSIPYSEVLAKIIE